MLRYQRHLATSVTTFNFSRRTALKKCLVASTSIENRRCSRYFKPRSKVVLQTFEIFLVKYACTFGRAFGFHDKHCLTSRFCLSVFKNNCLLFTSKHCWSSTCFCGGQTDKHRCLTSNISLLPNNGCSFGGAFR